MRGPVKIACDITRPDECAALFDRVEHQVGRPDVLINSAGYFYKQLLSDTPSTEWALTFDTNLFGLMVCAQEFARRAVAARRPGVVINIGSTTAALSTPGYGAYGASKAALVALTTALADEWRPHGIAVCCVAPAHTATDGIVEAIDAGFLDHDAVRAETPLGRIATTEEIADVVTFLADGGARTMSGQTLYVDGGRTAR